MKLKIICFSLLFQTVLLFSQECKIASVNMDSLYKYFPEMDSIKKAMAVFSHLFINYIEEMDFEIETKSKELIRMPGCTEHTIRSKKEEEIIQLDRRYMELSRNSKQIIASYRSQMLEYFYRELDRVIREISEQRGYMSVVNQKGLIYGNMLEDITEDIIEFIMTQYPQDERVRNWEKYKSKIDKEFSRYLK